MKNSFLMLLICIGNLAGAQNIEDGKYEVAVYLGQLTTFATRGPKGVTEVSEVKFLHPTSRSIGLAFDLRLAPQWFGGIEFFNDDFACGYEAYQERTFGGVGIQSGLLTNGDDVDVFKAGIRAGYRKNIGNRFECKVALIPSLAYYKFSSILDDTLYSNESYRRYPQRSVWYLTYPSVQNEGMYFLLKSSVEIIYKFRKRFSLSLNAAYQQGFSYFYEENINIVRPRTPTGYKEQIYWTKFNGTSLQGHLGIKYRFN